MPRVIQLNIDSLVVSDGDDTSVVYVFVWRPEAGRLNVAWKQDVFDIFNTTIFCFLEYSNVFVCIKSYGNNRE